LIFVYSEASHKVAALSTFFLDHLGESEKLSAPLTAGALAAAHSVRDLAAVGSKKGVREKIIEEMAGDENM
jgi:hypothetical protein